MRKILEYLKKLTSKKEKKGIIENCIIFIIIGIMIIIAGSTILKKKDKGQEQSYLRGGETNLSLEIENNIGQKDYEIYILEERLEKILSKIEGAGKVSVMVTYISGNEKVPAYDTKKSENNTKEEDERGGLREISQKDLEEKIAYEEVQSGTKQPIIIKEKEPLVKGVVVVADGAKDPLVKDNLTRAAQTLMDIPIHKVQVFAGALE